MIDAFAIGLSMVALIFAVGLSSYAQFLRRTFRGGALESPFKILIVSGVLYIGSAAYGILGQLGIISADTMSIMQSTFESLFLLTLFWGFYKIASVWKLSVKSQTYVPKAKSQIVQN